VHIQNFDYFIGFSNLGSRLTATFSLDQFDTKDLLENLLIRRQLSLMKNHSNINTRWFVNLQIFYFLLLLVLLLLYFKIIRLYISCKKFMSSRRMLHLLK